jgi:hypothetical protein
MHRQTGWGPLQEMRAKGQEKALEAVIEAIASAVFG